MKHSLENCSWARCRELVRTRVSDRITTMTLSSAPEKRAQISRQNSTSKLLTGFTVSVKRISWRPSESHQSLVISQVRRIICTLPYATVSNAQIMDNTKSIRKIISNKNGIFQDWWDRWQTLSRNSVSATVKNLKRASPIRVVSNVNMIINFFVPILNCRRPLLGRPFQQMLSLPLLKLSIQ